ncbi:hypothetical protein Tco_0541717, partial [Tanacetum coccineum]
RHIGEQRVQQARLQTLKSDFEMLHMKKDETIDTFTGKYDQPGLKEDHNNEGGSNRIKNDLPGCKDDHKHCRNRRECKDHRENRRQQGVQKISKFDQCYSEC